VTEHNSALSRTSPANNVVQTVQDSDNGDDFESNDQQPTSFQAESASGGGSSVAPGFPTSATLPNREDAASSNTHHTSSATGSGPNSGFGGQTTALSSLSEASAVSTPTADGQGNTTTISGTETAFVSGSSPTTPAAQEVIAEDAAHSLPASAPGSVTVINEQTSILAPTPLTTVAPILTVDGQTTHRQSPAHLQLSYSVPARRSHRVGVATVDGTRFSWGPDETQVVVGSQTETLGLTTLTGTEGGVATGVGLTPPTTVAPVLTVDGNTYTVSISGSSTAIILGSGETLTPGGAVTIDGTRFSSSPDGTQVVVGSEMETLGLATLTETETEGGVGGYVAMGVGDAEPFTGASRKMNYRPVAAVFALLGVTWAILTVT